MCCRAKEARKKCEKRLTIKFTIIFLIFVWGAPAPVNICFNRALTEFRS